MVSGKNPHFHLLLCARIVVYAAVSRARASRVGGVEGKTSTLFSSSIHSYKNQAALEPYIQTLLERGPDTPLLTKVPMLAPLPIRFYPMRTQRFMLPCNELD